MTTEIDEGPACGHLDWHIELAGMDGHDPRRAEIEACEVCSEEFAELDFLARATAGALLEEAPLSIDAAILDAASKRKRPRFGWVPWAAAAAAAVIAVAASYGQRNTPTDRLAADPETVALAEQVAEGEPIEPQGEAVEYEAAVEEEQEETAEIAAAERTGRNAQETRRAPRRGPENARSFHRTPEEEPEELERLAPAPAPVGETARVPAPVVTRAARDEADTLSEQQFATDLAALQREEVVNEVPAPTMVTSPSSRLLRLARSHRAAGSCAEAVRHYESLLANFRNAPEVPAALLEAGDCYRRLGRFARAEGVLQQATRYGRSREQAELDLRSVRAMRRSAETSARMVGAAVEESAVLAPAAPAPASED